MSALKTIFGAIAQRFNDWRERERAFAELSALDDHTLADLGLRRADIPFVVFAKGREQVEQDATASHSVPANNNKGLRAA